MALGDVCQCQKYKNTYFQTLNKNCDQKYMYQFLDTRYQAHMSRKQPHVLSKHY